MAILALTGDTLLAFGCVRPRLSLMTTTRKAILALAGVTLPAFGCVGTTITLMTTTRRANLALTGDTLLAFGLFCPHVAVPPPCRASAVWIPSWWWRFGSDLTAPRSGKEARPTFIAAVHIELTLNRQDRLIPA